MIILLKQKVFRLAILSIALSWPAVSQGVELFGVDLSAANRTQIDAAVKRAGAVLIPQRDGNTLFDVYESAKVLDHSHKLYLGFVSDTGKLAFLEYELNPRALRLYQTKLQLEYGEAQKSEAKYFKDIEHRWSSNGIQISLRHDYQAGVARLSYSHPQRLARLREDWGKQQQMQRQEELQKQNLYY